MITKLALPLLLLSLDARSAPLKVPYAPKGEYVLKLMTYNVKGLPLPWLKHKFRYGDIGKEIAKFRARGLGPHVLGLQEAFVKKCGEVGGLAGMPHRARGPGARGLRINAGIEILSDYPILETRNLLYSKCQGTDCFARKGAVFARIQVPGLPVPVDVYDTHMNAGGPKGRKARLTQVREFMELVRSTHRPGNILISLGDFNFIPRNPEYRVLEEGLGMANAGEECGVLMDCQGDEDPYQEWQSTVDHVFHKDTDEIEVRPVHYELALYDRTQGRRWSDHEALIVHYLIRW